jgi:hypothetical protein
MKLLLCVLPAAFLASCTTKLESNCIGTWAMNSIAPSRYYLRVYPDGRVAQWPSPPDGKVSWSRLRGNELLWGLGMEGNPRIFSKGAELNMWTASGTQTLSRLSAELEPGEYAKED